MKARPASITSADSTTGNTYCAYTVIRFLRAQLADILSASVTQNQVRALSQPLSHFSKADDVLALHRQTPPAVGAPAEAVHRAAVAAAAAEAADRAADVDRVPRVDAAREGAEDEDDERGRAGGISEIVAKQVGWWRLRGHSQMTSAEKGSEGVTQNLMH